MICPVAIKERGKNSRSRAFEKKDKKGRPREYGRDKKGGKLPKREGGQSNLSMQRKEASRIPQGGSRTWGTLKFARLNLLEKEGG